MTTAILIVAAGLLIAFGLSFVLHSLANDTAAVVEARIPQMLDVSKVLAGGIALVSTALALFASRSGGAGRVLANAEDRFLLGVALVVVSVALSIAAMTVVASAPTRGLVGVWLAMTMISLGTFVAGVFNVAAASRDASDVFEAPSVGATLKVRDVSFEVSLPLLTAADTLTVTDYAYPPGVEAIPIPQDGEGESRGVELYRGTTGPGADGLATVKGGVPVPEGDFEQVEVRAYRNGIDLGCLDYFGDAGRTGCVQLWIVPRVQDS